MTHFIRALVAFTLAAAGLGARAEAPTATASGAASASAAAPAAVSAPAPDARPPLPSALSGHWKYTPPGIWFSLTQQFKLRDIEANADGSFHALLSWYGSNDRCYVDRSPIRGAVTADGGLEFEVVVPDCYTMLARLNRDGRRWTGKAAPPGPDSIVLDLAAR